MWLLSSYGKGFLGGALSAEQRLVRLAARSFVATGGEEEIVQSLRRSFDELRLVDCAAREGMAGIVAAELLRIDRRHHLDRIPARRLSRMARSVFAHSGMHFSALLKLGEALKGERLRVIALKGAALLDGVYDRRFALRPLSDIDLLVDAADLPRLEERLRSQGFLAPSATPQVFTRDRLAFDLHTDVQSGARIRRRSLAFRPASERLWEHARPMRGTGGSILVLSEVHQFLHASIHALKHSYSRLIWLMDLALLLRRVDWEELIEEAEASGTIRAVSYACFGLHRVLDVAPPPGWTACLPSLNRCERAFVDSMERRPDALPTGELLVAFSIPGWRDRAAYLLELALPRRAVLCRLFPRTPRWLLVPRRCLQLLGRGLAGALRVAGRLRQRGAHILL